MRAAVQREPGGTFVIEDVDLTGPGDREVVVDVRAAGVCATDLSLTTTFGQPTPVVLGHEGAGTVTAVGSGVDTVAVGDHVVVVWVPPCGHCAACRRGDQYLCSNRRSTSRDGAATTSPLHRGDETIHQGMSTATFAEQVVLPQNAVVRIDDDVPWDVAAMLGCAVPTGVGAALRSAQVSPGDSVGVIGAGAVGLNAVMGAVVAGASRVVAVDPMASRRAFALTVGATESVDPDTFAELRELDVVIDAVGHPPTIRAAWNAVRRGGTVTVVGAAKPGQTVEVSAYELFHDDKRLTGSWHGGMSMHRDLPMLVALWRAGRLPVDTLIDGHADLADINDVVAAQRAGDVVRRILVPRP